MLRISNDPFYFILRAFEELYPDKKSVVIHFVDMDEIDKESDQDTGYGVTIFPDDPNEPVYVYVDYKLEVRHAAEILAHELAHVAAGANAGHDHEWERAFDAIFERSQEMYMDSIGKGGGSHEWKNDSWTEKQAKSSPEKPCTCGQMSL